MPENFRYGCKDQAIMDKVSERDGGGWTTSHSICIFSAEIWRKVMVEASSNKCSICSKVVLVQCFLRTDLTRYTLATMILIRTVHRFAKLRQYLWQSFYHTKIRCEFGWETLDCWDEGCLLSLILWRIINHRTNVFFVPKFLLQTTMGSNPFLQTKDQQSKYCSHDFSEIQNNDQPLNIKDIITIFTETRKMNFSVERSEDETLTPLLIYSPLHFLFWELLFSFHVVMVRVWRPKVTKLTTETYLQSRDWRRIH